jgi:hypothetical protein
MTDTKWIMFAKRSSRDNCIGKGRILDCKIVGDFSATSIYHNSLYIDMTLDGVRFVGNLADLRHTDEEE